MAEWFVDRYNELLQWLSLPMKILIVLWGLYLAVGFSYKILRNKNLPLLNFCDKNKRKYCESVGCGCPRY
tara:strand:- start:427 stop:636 length:210 start_codon:yes stop_codon:yes gene_type:complete